MSHLLKTEKQSEREVEMLRKILVSQKQIYMEKSAMNTNSSEL